MSPCAQRSMTFDRPWPTFRPSFVGVRGAVIERVCDDERSPNRTREVAGGSDRSVHRSVTQIRRKLTPSPKTPPYTQRDSDAIFFHIYARSFSKVYIWPYIYFGFSPPRCRLPVAFFLLVCILLYVVLYCMLF